MIFSARKELSQLPAGPENAVEMFERADQILVEHSRAFVFRSGGDREHYFKTGIPRVTHATSEGRICRISHVVGYDLPGRSDENNYDTIGLVDVADRFLLPPKRSLFPYGLTRMIIINKEPAYTISPNAITKLYPTAEGGNHYSYPNSVALDEVNLCLEQLESSTIRDYKHRGFKLTGEYPRRKRELIKLAGEFILDLNN